MLPALAACGTGIDVEAVEGFIVENFEDVRVARNEEVWRVGKDFRADASVVVAGVSADVFH